MRYSKVVLVIAIAFSLSVLAELGLHVPGVWLARKVLAWLAVTCGLIACAGLLAWRFDLFSVILGLLGLYRFVNMGRILRQQMHDRYLHRATIGSSLWLVALQLMTAGLWAAWIAWHQTGHTVWGVIAAVQVLVALGSLASVTYTIRRTQWPAAPRALADHELPTLSVAIPARNETDDLQACLLTLISNDYPKLEILVLDDCSQNKRTPEIIRSFAHDGVRFIQGGEPEPTWLPKNWAYKRLAEEASGDYILFCGVDIRFTPSSLRQVVQTALERRKAMLCILPEQAPHTYGSASLLQAMRYWWELVPPRRLFKRPPVLSSCWLVERQMLQKAGGFASVARSIVPEAHFAAVSTKLADSYSFLRSMPNVGVQSVKKTTDQRNTAVRMRYPQVHRRPEQAALHSLAELAFLLLPFALAVGGFWVSVGPVAQWLAAAACLLLVITHQLVVLSTRVNTWWFGLFAMPIMLVVDIYMLNYSMLRYEFGTVQWRDRNICIPAMHVVPHLPNV